MRPFRCDIIEGSERNGQAPAGIQMSFASGYVGSGGKTPTIV